MSRSKNWCFTLNNYTPEELTLYSKLVETHENVVYCVFGRERGEEGTPHLQGYLQLGTRLRLGQIRRICPRAHLEARKGSHVQARDYCMKDGHSLEEGEPEEVQQGKRNDLVALKNDLDAGKRNRDIADNHFGSFLKYQRGINAYRLARAKDRDWMCSVVIYWGRSGAGKTRSVIDNIPDREDIYIHPGEPWFDGYDQHPIVLFDDFGGSEFKLTYLLKLLDRYPMRVPIKGGYVQWVPKEIYITSNQDPMLWFARALPEHVNALMRRVTNIVCFP